MKTPLPSPQTSPAQPMSAKPSLADQIAASKAQGGKAPVKPAAPASASAKPANQTSQIEDQPSRSAEVRAALVREWKELWKDRTSRIVLLWTAGAVAAGIAWGAVFYARKPVEPKKKPDPAELVQKEPEKTEDTITPEERLAIHKSIIEGTPYEMPAKKPEKAEAPEPVSEPKPVEKPVQSAAKSEMVEAQKLQAKRNEIAETGQLKVSTNPEDMKATMEALKEWSRQDAESARAKASKR